MASAFCRTQPRIRLPIHGLYDSKFSCPFIPCSRLPKSGLSKYGATHCGRGISISINANASLPIVVSTMGIHIIHYDQDPRPKAPAVSKRFRFDPKNFPLLASLERVTATHDHVLVDPAPSTELKGEIIANELPRTLTYHRQLEIHFRGGGHGQALFKRGCL